MWVCVGVCVCVIVCGCVCDCVWVCVCRSVCVFVCVACFKMLKGIHARTHTICVTNIICIIFVCPLCFLFGASAPCSGHGLHLLGGSIQLKFYEVVLSVLRPTPAILDDRWVGCFFILFLTTKLPGMGDPASSYATASVALCVIATQKLHHLAIIVTISKYEVCK